MYTVDMDDKDAVETAIRKALQAFDDGQVHVSPRHFLSLDLFSFSLHGILGFSDLVVAVVVMLLLALKFAYFFVFSLLATSSIK